MDDHTYQARFKASYLRFLSYTTSVQLTATAEQGRVRFHGSENLGWLAGGQYEYRGEATSASFHSTYECPRDHGVFELSRPR